MVLCLLFDWCLQIRIVFGIDDPEVARLDNGAFLEWLQKQDDEAEQGSSSGARLASLQPRVAVIGHNFKPIPENLEAPELRSLSRPIAAARKEAGIATPSYINIPTSSAQGTSKAYYCGLVENTSVRDLPILTLQNPPPRPPPKPILSSPLCPSVAQAKGQLVVTIRFS